MWGIPLLASVAEESTFLRQFNENLFPVVCSTLPAPPLDAEIDDVLSAAFEEEEAGGGGGEAGATAGGSALVGAARLPEG